MPDLHGFEVVGELTVAVLNNVLKGAWDNDIIPHSTNIDPNTPVGPYHVHDGVVNIARDGVSLVMDRPANGVRVALHCEIQAHIADAPIPSASFFDIQADVSVSVPIGVLPDDSKKVAALLNDVPRSAVSATITSGNPIPGLTTSGIEEYVHKQYHDGLIKDHYEQTGVSFGGFSGDAWVDVYDDQSKPNHHITVVDVGGGKVKVVIPIHLKLSNLTGLAAAVSPMGVVANITLTTPVTANPGSITAPVKTQGVIALEGYAPSPASDPEVGSFDSEGSHYTTALSYFPTLEMLIKGQLTSRAGDIANAIGDIVIPVPTQSDIEGFIADQAHKAVVNRGNIGLWTPNPPPGGDVTLRNVKPQALTDAIAFCINDSPGADSLAIGNFIPAGFSCGIAISAAKVLEIVDKQIHKPESDGGFGPDFPHTPHHENADGHDAKVTRLDVSLRDGSIHVEGDVTVVDAIADSIDVDASFEAEIGLQFEDNTDGTQKVQPFTISQDVDLSLLAWILSFLTGFITFGIVGGIIALVVMAVVEGIAEKIGGTIIRDEVTGQIKGIGAWPQSLDGIGEVHARFENPILIDPSGILFADAYHVVATFASVTDALADANGPYSVPEGAEIEFDGGPIKPNTTYSWDLGDGTVLAGAVVNHRYADNGLYVAKLTTVVHEEGGVTTRHFAAVRVTNVAATVDAGPSITIDEGAVTEFTATFTDPGWVDTHKAIFDFGDNSNPVVGTVTETNKEPEARGTVKASHAYCDNGTYTVTVRVIDDDGGVGVDTKTVIVRNVAPTVDAGPDMFAYMCTPITLVG
ncbi:MAG: PKD domain-containing protein, partial [Thermoanaerobaculia bacterium]